MNYGVCLSPFLTDSYADLVRLAREAEAYGFGGIFIPEAANDGLMCCDAIARATSRVRLASWIANIYLRQPMLCASAAAMVQEAADGRFVLGLGVSHRPMLEALGMEMRDARAYLSHYITAIRAVLSGQPIGPLRVRVPLTPVPIHVAALALETIRLGAELADGLMLDNCTPERLGRAIKVAGATRARFGRQSAPFEITTGVLVFLHQRSDRAYDAARRSIARYAMLPAYNRLFANSGFIAEAKTITEAATRNDAAAAAAAVNDRMVDALSITGSPARCRERLDQYARLGADNLVLRPSPVDEDYATCVRQALRALSSAL
ncbi:MAG: LLM class flavin-dependent oxidoreductase [Candidatus Binataceae bacterium]